MRHSGEVFFAVMPGIGMSILRQLYGWPLVALLPFLPACAVSIGSGSGHETRETTWPTTAEAPAKAPVPFAITRKPGVSIPLNPAKPDVVKVEPPPTIPEVPPIAKETSPGELPPTVIPPPPEAPLVGILKAYLEGRPEAAMPLIQTLDKPNREMVLQLVPALVKASKLNPAQADPKELAMVAGQFTAVADQLNKRAPLTIEKAVFCRSVTNFGRYVAMPPNAVLRPGTTNIIYFELGNVASEPAQQNGTDGYLTKLLCSWQIRDSNDRPLIIIRDRQENYQQIDPKLDFSQSPLRDYYLQLQFNAPMTPGQYSVQFKVKDSITGREVARALSFRVP